MLVNRDFLALCDFHLTLGWNREERTSRSPALNTYYSQAVTHLSADAAIGVQQTIISYYRRKIFTLGEQKFFFALGLGDDIVQFILFEFQVA